MAGSQAGAQGGSGAWGEEGYFLFLLWGGDAGEATGPQDRHGGGAKEGQEEHI